MAQQQSEHPPYPRDWPPYEDEVDLIDYLRVLWRRKWLIIGGVLACAACAAVIGLLMPRVYEVSTIIEPGIANVKDDGSLLYIDSVSNIGTKINEMLYNKRIEDVLHLDPSATKIRFKASIPKGAHMVKIGSLWKEGRIDLGVKATRYLLDALCDDYKEIVEQKRGVYDKQILMKQNEIGRIARRMESLEIAKRYIIQRMDKLEEEADRIKKNTDDLIAQRNLLLKKGKADTEMPLLLYSTTIQQNISYFNEINNQSYNLKREREEVQKEIKSLEKDIDNIKTEIAAFNSIKEMIGGIRIIQEPEVSRRPVKPKKTQIVLLSAVVSLFFFILLAFFIEYIRKASTGKE